MKNFTLLSATNSTLADVIPFEVTVTHFEPEPFSQAPFGEVVAFSPLRDPAAICGLALVEDVEFADVVAFVA